MKLIKQIRWKKLWPIGVCLLVLLAVNSDIFFGGRTLLPIAPGYAVLPGAPSGYTGVFSYGLTTIDPAGVLNVSYAFDALTASSLVHGILPLWNPYQGLGQPFLANGISDVLFPLTWLQALISPAYWDLVYLIPWLLTALFLYIFLRLWKLDTGAALFGGALLMCSGLIQFYVTLREYAATFCWLPLMLYVIERALRDPHWRYRHLLLGLGVAGTFLGGQPEVYAVSFTCVTAYAVVRLIQYRCSLRLLWSLLPGTVAGILISLPALVSFATYAFSAFSNHDSSVQLGTTHLPLSTVSTYVFPFLFGHSNLSLYVEGWFPFLGVFLLLVALCSLGKKTTGLWFFVITMAVISAKIWGAPFINELGSFPVFDRILFPRYASFLLLISGAVVAAFGIHSLVHLEIKKWLIRLAIWCLALFGILYLGFSTIAPTIDWTTWNTPQNLYLLLYGGASLVWAVCLPLGLWVIKKFRPTEDGLFYLVSFAGIILQAIVYNLNGYQTFVYGILSAVCFAIFALLILLIVLIKKVRFSTGLVGVIFILIAAIPLTTSHLAPEGEPNRYNPLTTAPYLKKLNSLQLGGQYRSYSFDGTPQPNFAAPFGLSSLNNVEAVMPANSAAYMFSYLDNYISPIWFAGNLSFNRAPGTALSEYTKNERYFNFIGVKYLVTDNTSLGTTLYNTENLGFTRTPTPLFTPIDAHFFAPGSELTHIDVLLSTYGKKNPGIVRIEILDEVGNLLTEASVEGIGLVDNSFQGFDFPSVSTTPETPLVLRLSFTPSTPDSMIAAWMYADAPQVGFTFRITQEHYPLIYTDPKNNVMIWENTQALPRVFLVSNTQVEPDQTKAFAKVANIPDLRQQVIINTGESISSDWPSSQSTGELSHFRLQPNTVDFTFNAHTTGILVLTDTFAPGWEATVNGQPIEILEVNGTFRGLYIQGPGIYKVQFRYRPPYWNITVSAAGLGLLILLVASFFPKTFTKRATQTES